MKKNWHFILAILIVLLAVVVRSFAFGLNNIFEDDETRFLLQIMDINFLSCFLPLGGGQSAPVVFVLIEKILLHISNSSELILKSISYLASIISIFFFYKLSDKFFDRKYSILVALFLFAVNYRLVFFSSIVKPYSIDILIGVLCIYYLSDITISKLSNKKLVALGITLCTLPFISLTSLFFIGALFLKNIVYDFKNSKKTFISILPFILIFVIYYIFNLGPSKADLDLNFPNYWQDGFITFKNIIIILVNEFRYIFSPNTVVLFELIIFFIGFYYCAKRKDEITQYVSFVLFLAIVASILHLYPISGRVSLYLIPIAILISTKAIDSLNFKKVSTYFILFFTIIGFIAYNPFYIKTLFEKQSYVRYSPKVLLFDLKEKYNNKIDTIIVNGASASGFAFYSKKYDFAPKRAYEIPSQKEGNKDELIKYLNSLPSGRYWFYLINDYAFMPILPEILGWIKYQKIIYAKQDIYSYLILINL